MRHIRTTAVLCGAGLIGLALGAPATIEAQGQARSNVRVPPPGVLFQAPQLVDVRETEDALLHSLQGDRMDRNVRWMIIGGGLLVGGAIIGDDVGTIVSLSGLVIGGIGLYRYLQ